jgi:hypothetical protein
MAPWVRERTTVTLIWVSEELGMRHYTRVTRAVCRMKRKPMKETGKAAAETSANGQMRSPKIKKVTFPEPFHFYKRVCQTGHRWAAAPGNDPNGAE